MRKLLTKLFGASSNTDQKPKTETAAEHSTAPAAPTQPHGPSASLKDQINHALEQQNFSGAEPMLSEAIHQEPHNLSLRTNHAYTLIQLGRIGEAEAALQAALQIDAKHLDTHFMLAGLLTAQGQHQAAFTSYQDCLQLDSRFAPAYLNAIRLAIDLGQLEQALHLLNQARQSNLHLVDFDMLAGEALQRSGRIKEAIHAYQAVLQQQASLSLAHFRLAELLAEINRIDQAIPHAETFLQQNPRLLPAVLLLGRLHMQSEHLEVALSYFEQARELDPQSIEALANGGSMLQQLGRYDEALLRYETVLKIAPHIAIVWHNKGRIAYDRKDFEGARIALEQALQLQPNDPNMVHHYGLALTGLERYQEAIQQYDRAIALNPQHPFAYFDRGKTSLRLERYDTALVDLEHSIQLTPNFPEANFEIAFALLAKGQLARGFQQYEWRWRCDPFKTKIRPFLQPAWDGILPIMGKRILVFAEQGLGDSIQFARYAIELLERGAIPILEVQPPLVTLFKQLPGIQHVIAQGDPLPAFDLHAPLMSLPKLCGTDLNSVPSRASYYEHQQIGSSALHDWANQIQPSTRKKIGVVWAGSRDFVHDKKRSVPFAVFEKLLQVDAQFHCLQKEISDADLHSLQKYGIPFHGNELDDLLETAALISQMDLVITVDTSIAHLAGSLGKPTFIMLPFNPDWRWMLERQDTPWYPSARLFRQRKIYDWEPVIANIEEELRSVIA
ncbi:tetratricopeptide repeat protein [Undibacterium cyanobacteriorum]|uniref:Tetratricopeptide repeat protein n=1 Tax=Undibacterium cyanobacteriorum TaxID=3073561 RepID=A0ABY9REN4_9BURK|nr:tetratricopeptide repeat protein [Undibacterium sp. 20NA77.5]WMW79686.1 tetratricopeptide repeat protein [Undibacterium sp. 20NA77.5]